MASVYLHSKQSQVAFYNIFPSVNCVKFLIHNRAAWQAFQTQKGLLIVKQAAQGGDYYKRYLLFLYTLPYYLFQYLAASQDVRPFLVVFVFFFNGHGYQHIVFVFYEVHLDNTHIVFHDIGQKELARRNGVGTCSGIEEVGFILVLPAGKGAGIQHLYVAILGECPVDTYALIPVWIGGEIGDIGKRCQVYRFIKNQVVVSLEYHINGGYGGGAERIEHKPSVFFQQGFVVFYVGSIN